MHTQTPIRPSRPTAEVPRGRLDTGPATTTPSDAALFTRARRGDEQAWRSLVERYTPLLSSVARAHRLGAAEVADAVQVTWLRCVEHVDRIYAPDRLRAWLVTTCRNECLRLLRQARRTTPDDSTDASGPLARLNDPDTHGDPQAWAERVESCARLRDAIAELPARQRQVVGALFASGGARDHHYADLAAALGVPIGSIGPTRQRALRSLRRDRRLAHLHP